MKSVGAMPEPPKKGKKEPREIQVSVDDTEIVEVDETREPASVVFIGHVDAGKSTICGNLMLLTGVIDKRTVEKFKQEAKEKGRDSWLFGHFCQKGRI